MLLCFREDFTPVSVHVGSKWIANFMYQRRSEHLNECIFMDSLFVGYLTLLSTCMNRKCVQSVIDLCELSPPHVGGAVRSGPATLGALGYSRREPGCANPTTNTAKCVFNRCDTRSFDHRRSIFGT